MQLLWKNSLEFLKKFNVKLLHDPASPFLAKPRKPKTHAHTETYSVPCSIDHHSQKMEAAQVSVAGWMGEQAVAYTYSAAFCSHEMIRHLYMLLLG